MEVKKLLKKEVSTLQEFQVKNNEIIGGLGTIEIRINALKKQKRELLEEFDKLSKDQNQTAKELEDKYGNGNIDLDKGEFTPIA
jgi:hypothetical protein|tara:strand:- start:1202 stop:1453 length:252 start_codon:yes stop_codon:yes gene_type:complete